MIQTRAGCTVINPGTHMHRARTHVREVPVIQCRANSDMGKSVRCPIKPQRTAVKRS
jgi:hypothetical protein